MDALGQVLTIGVMAADAIRARPLQLLAARFVHRWYKVGGLLAAGYRPGTGNARSGPA
jgi:hypothetical protein